MNDEGRLLGSGIHFPPKINAEGRWAWSSGAENIRQAIQVILQTEPMERIMLPEFGGGLKHLLFQPNVTSTHRLIEENITQSLKRWEPRITLQSVDSEIDPDDPEAVLVTVHYSLVSTQQSDKIQLRVLLNN